ncbi:MAG: NADH:flavin oxidoreductase [Deltaproteobacteria bacterium]|nr:NADH:flavin oxidoreductase [Deltaproteobacteria bacterium]
MKLFEPINVSSMELKNRIMFPPMVSKRAAGQTGFVTEDLIDLYVSIAKGGAGIVVLEFASIWPPQMTLLGIHHDACIPGLKALVDAVHSQSDAKIVIQVGDHLPGMVNIEEVPTEMFEAFTGSFMAAAGRAKLAGFDGIEIHGAHGYFLAASLSHRNRRKDEYGKNLEGRMRLITQTIQGCKQVCGDDYPIGVRINADEFIVGGNTLHQTRRIAAKLAELGVAYISLSVGGKNQDAWHVMDTVLCFPYPKPGPWDDAKGYSGHRCVPPNYMHDGTNVYLAEDIRKHVRKAGFDTPVITAGKIPTPKFANEILENEQADMVAVCRAILCDHEWPNKAKERRAKDIVKCMYCNHCFDGARRGYYTACKRWKGWVDKRADMEVGIS